jgi:hypothetical protein
MRRKNELAGSLRRPDILSYEAMLHGAFDDGGNCGIRTATGFGADFFSIRITATVTIGHATTSAAAASAASNRGAGGAENGCTGRGSQGCSSQAPLVQ